MEFFFGLLTPNLLVLFADSEHKYFLAMFKGWKVCDSLWRHIPRVLFVLIRECGTGSKTRFILRIPYPDTTIKIAVRKGGKWGRYSQYCLHFLGLASNRWLRRFWP